MTALPPVNSQTCDSTDKKQVKSGLPEALLQGRCMYCRIRPGDTKAHTGRHNQGQLPLQQTCTRNNTADQQRLGHHPRQAA